MSKQFEIHIPDQLWQQAQSMVKQGWINNMDSLIVESMRRYIESHQPTTHDDLIREGIDWSLRGND
jgi:Arc/MetJ-type ribon-helix-helix transcriptional regulator